MRMRATFALLLILAVVLSGATKRVMYEHFTSTTCGPCAGWEPSLIEVVESYDANDIVQVDYHVWWPAAGDPFWEANEPPQEAAVTLYEVSGVPAMFFDYAEPDFSDISTYAEGVAIMQGLVDDALATTTPIGVSIRVTSEEIQVTVDVEEALTGDYHMRVMLTEDNIHYTAPNGMTEFHNAFREAYPDFDGTVVDLSTPGSETYAFEYTIDGAWNPVELNAIAFIQNSSTLAMVNCNEAAVPPPAYVFALTSDTPNMTCMPDLAEAVMYGEIANNGTETDDFEMSLSGDWPDEWSVSWCSGDLCMSAEGDCTTNLTSGASEELSVHVAPSGFAGEGTFTITVHSVAGDATQELDFELNVIGTEGDILLISDGLDFGGAPVDNSGPYCDALDALGIDYVVYDRSAGPVPSDFLNAFPMAIWFTAAGYSDVLDADDVAAVTSYLELGGKTFWMSSSDFAWDIAGISPGFFDDYFHTTFDSGTDDECSSHNIHGTGSPWSEISDTLVAYEENFTRYMDICHPDAEATPILYYNTSGTSENAGFIYEGDYNLIYTGFGFEYMSDEDMRESFMQMLTNHFLEGIEEKGNVPENFAIQGNYPNPFNPTTEVVFSVDVTGESKLEVVDIVGRHVATLVDEEIAAGTHRILWNGQDDLGNTVPTGLYMIKLTGEDKQAIKTVILAK